MRFIGITGGVGAGKSAILEYIDRMPDSRVMLADEIAHELMEPGSECYNRLKQLFAKEDVFLAEGGFDKLKLATVIFGDDRKRNMLNDVVHPAVKDYVIQQFEAEKNKGKLQILVIEAALLIEEHYDEICDELWYIYTDEKNRRLRLKESRGYSDEKIDNILASQLSEAEYRAHCSVVIDNNGDITKTYEQIEAQLRNNKE